MSQDLTTFSKSRSRLGARIVDASALSPEHRAHWHAIIEDQPLLDGPSFDPDFVCRLGQFIVGARVGILELGGSVVGYVPFAKADGSTAGPIVMSDYQAVILERGTEAQARDIVRALGLRSMRFDGVPVDHFTIADVHAPQGVSAPRIDISAGYERYVAEMAARGRSGKKFATNLRLLERDHGDVRLDHGISSDAALSSLLALKGARYGRNGVFEPWVHSALQAFHGRQVGRIQGQLSVLRAGSQDVAYLFCLKRGGLLYYWFPTFNPAFAKYSPGLLALWMLIRDLPLLGCDRIDMGPGGESYKVQFANQSLCLATAQVYSSPAEAGMRRLLGGARRRLAETRWVQTYVKPLVGSLLGSKPRQKSEMSEPS